ncbi:MAG: hypothetical protein ACFBQW_02860 [Sphingomonadaceae bacterium]
MTDSLLIHETGPDGDSTYELRNGTDISAELAEELIQKSGGREGYAMHHYENGEKKASFVSKAVYDAFQEQVKLIPKPRSVDEIKADMDRQLGARSEAASGKPWWAFWRR